MTTIDKNREIRYMNIAKAFGIIAVVVGHSGSPITHFIYQWHMALFFFISGYFYKDTYSKTPILFIRKRIKSLYFPYIQYGIVFLLLHNLFFQVNIYSYKLGLLGKASHLYTKGELLINLLNTLTLGTKEQLLGIFWFITTLIIVNILFCSVNVFVEQFCRVQRRISKEKLRLLIIFIFFIIGNILAFQNVHLPRHIDTSLVAIAIYYCGYLYHKHETQFTMSLYYAIIAFILLLVNSLYGDIQLGLHLYVSPSFFLINSFMGIYVILFCSKYLTVKLKSRNILEYIGRNTFMIMALHFLSFKVINLLQIMSYNLPYYKLAMFPTINGSGQWWIAYSLCGVFIPLGLSAIIDKLKIDAHIVYRVL